MAVTKEGIKGWFLEGDNGENSHMIVVCDTYDHSDYPVYIKKGEDINLRMLDYNYQNMQKIMEIYNYSMDMGRQLSSAKAYNVSNSTIPKCQTLPEGALEFATKKHEGAKRKASGEDYIKHPISVVALIKKYKKSSNLDILEAAGYLHDVLEETDATYYELVKLFDFAVASLVLELTTNEEMKEEIGKDKYLAYKLKHMTSWALVIKLCDRLDNVSDLDAMPKEFRERYIKETLFIIEYLDKNRELSYTHNKIISDIMTKIEDIMKKVADGISLAYIHNT